MSLHPYLKHASAYGHNTLTRLSLSVTINLLDRQWFSAFGKRTGASVTNTSPFTAFRTEPFTLPHFRKRTGQQATMVRTQTTPVPCHRLEENGAQAH